MRRSNIKVMSRLFVMMKPLYPVLAAAVGAGVIGYLFAAFIPVMGGYAILAALGQPVLSMPAVILLIAVFALSRGLLRFAEQYANHYIAFRILAIFRDRIFAALRKLSPAKLEGRNKGDLISLITSDIELMEVFYAHTVSPVAIALLCCGFFLVFLGFIHPLVSLAALAGYLLTGLVLPVLQSRSGKEKGRRCREEMAAMNSDYHESLRGLQETIQYNDAQKRREAITQKNDTLFQLQAELTRREGHFKAGGAAALSVCGLITLLTTALLYANNLIGAEGVVIGSLAVMSSFGPVLALSSLATDLIQTFAAANRVLDLLDEAPIVPEVTDGVDARLTSADMENVSFAYEGEEILRGISLSVPEKSIVGITGKSGSGKSTLLRLLMRFWDPQRGKIRLSGLDIRKINTESLRENESFVTQDTHLFNESILDNIKLAKPEATDEEVAEACKKAAIHDFITALPDGYATKVGELGDRLSGGERQRLGLARAFVHDAPLILLDEPTSNLDSRNEAVILRSIRRAREDKTIILVSHRKSTMRITDTACTVENGTRSS